jgi:hypothetical protein
MVLYPHPWSRERASRAVIRVNSEYFFIKGILLDMSFPAFYRRVCNECIIAFFFAIAMAGNTIPAGADRSRRFYLLKSRDFSKIGIV